MMCWRRGILFLLGFVALPAFAGVTIEWNRHALNAIRAEQSPSPEAARTLAILHAGIFDSLNSFERPYAPYAHGVAAPTNAVPDLVAAQAAADLLTWLFPNQSQVFETALTSAVSSAQSQWSGLDISVSLHHGSAVAGVLIDLRANDQSDQNEAWFAGNEPGVWRPSSQGRTALLPQWRNVTPFALNRIDQFELPGPPPLDSHQYLLDFETVRQVGKQNSNLRDARDTDTAHWWHHGPGTSTPAGHWNLFLPELVMQHGLTELEAARLYALLNFALADACIAAWRGKYQFGFWRPAAAIAAADDDGNNSTIGEAEWQPLIDGPETPAYASAQSTCDGAASRLLASYFGNDGLWFQAGSDSLPNEIRAFNAFSEAAVESGASRIYAGQQFPFSDKDGRTMGQQIAEQIFSSTLQSVAEDASIVLTAWSDLNHSRRFDQPPSVTGISGVRISLDKQTGIDTNGVALFAPVAEGQTSPHLGNQGLIRFDHLPPATYRVQVDLESPALQDVIETVTPAHLLVDLARGQRYTDGFGFSERPSASDDVVIEFFAAHLNDNAVVTWRTLTETGLRGFNLYRINDQGGTRKLTTQPILSRNELTGSTYNFVDGAVDKSRDYTYQIEALHQNRSLFSTPIVLQAAGREEVDPIDPSDPVAPVDPATPDPGPPVPQDSVVDGPAPDGDREPAVNPPTETPSSGDSEFPSEPPDDGDETVVQRDPTPAIPIGSRRPTRRFELPRNMVDSPGGTTDFRHGIGSLVAPGWPVQEPFRVQDSEDIGLATRPVPRFDPLGGFTLKSVRSSSTLPRGNPFAAQGDQAEGIAIDSELSEPGRLFYKTISDQIWENMSFEPGPVAIALAPVQPENVKPDPPRFASMAMHGAFFLLAGLSVLLALTVVVPLPKRT